MELEELPPAIQDAFKNLRFNSASIECDVHDALEHADTLEDFKNNVENAIDSLIFELQTTRTAICDTG